MAEQPGYRGWPVVLYIDSTAVSLAVTKVTGVGAKVETIDVTSQLSADSYKEKLKSLRDAGSFTMEINARPDETGDETLVTSLENDDWDTIGVLWPDGSYWEADGGVTGYEGNGGIGEKFSGTVEITLSGPWDFAASTPTTGA